MSKHPIPKKSKITTAEPATGKVGMRGPDVIPEGVLGSKTVVQPRYRTPGEDEKYAIPWSWKDISCEVILEGDDLIGLKCETKGYVNPYCFPVAYLEITRSDFDTLDERLQYQVAMRMEKDECHLFHLNRYERAFFFSEEGLKVRYDGALVFSTVGPCEAGQPKGE